MKKIIYKNKLFNENQKGDWYLQVLTALYIDTNIGRFLGEMTDKETPHWHKSTTTLPSTPQLTRIKEIWQIVKA